jgi:mRNA-degrading endonuclease RelE of RelBE toxin-antitoxin system
MSYNVFTTSSFQKEFKSLIKKYPSITKDLANTTDIIKDNPFTGVSIGNSCYKVRMSITSKGKGKSGGARLITCVKVVKQSIFLLSIYDKSDKNTIDDDELIQRLRAEGLL